MRTLKKVVRWMAGFLEGGTPQSSARLIAVAGFTVGTVIAFKWPDRLSLIGLFVVSTAVAIAMRTMGQPPSDPPGGPTGGLT